MEIVTASKKEIEFIDEKLIEFNNYNIPFKQTEAFIEINKCVKNNEGVVIGGISATMEMWKILHINIFWVSAQARNKGIGSLLLSEVEKEAQLKGCKMSYLETFDFQAKSFYEKYGYVVFGQLEECPEGHSQFFMQKRF